MSEPVVGEQTETVEELHRELAKLRKINAVLMDRVERSTDWQGNAFSTFQAAIVLEGRVEERSIQLEAALRQVEAANESLSQAKDVAETARRRLREAIENISEGFALFDADDRLVTWNNNFVDLMSALGQGVAVGTRFTQVIHVAVAKGTVRDAIGQEEAWIAGRLAHHHHPDRPFVYRLADGRWIQVNERRTHEGGTVAIYTDITDIKHSEEQRRERELAKKSELLQATLESLSQGVAVFDRDLRLAAWNDRYFNLFGFPRDLARVGTAYADLSCCGGRDVEKGHPGKLAALLMEAARGELPQSFEHVLPDQRIVEVATHAMPDGGVVNTYSDITERKRADMLLRDSERQLKAAALRLQRANESLEHRVAMRTAELSAVNQALTEAKVAAEQANQSKTKFLAAASHDLHQPLNAARLFAAALGESKVLTETERDLVVGIDNALEAIDALLRALFDISKLDAGVMSAEIVVGPLAPLLDQLGREYMPQAREAGLDLTVVPCRLAVRSDLRLLARILRNFLSNALRYTERGRILLGCRRRGDVLSIEIWDTGSGIPPDRIPDIFQEFQQIDMPGRRRDKGIGLGLAIVERISRLLRHPIRVRSQPGRGSCFSVEVPIVTGASAGQAEAEPPQLLASPGNLAGLDVVAIDDDPAGLEAISALLTAWGCHVTPLRSGGDLAVWLETNPPRPGMLVADYHLGDGTNGLEQIRKMRRRFGVDLPAFIVTSDRDPSLRAAAKAQGISCLNKPLASAKLRALMTHLLGCYHALQ